MQPSADALGVPSGRPVIVLVEDHQDTRQMYVEFLSVSFDVLPAADGPGALEIMRARRPDLLITDLSLPGMDGFELVSRVRKDPLMKNVPVICLSGYGGHTHEQRARDAGCDHILQKPCMPDALAEVALEVLLAARERGIT
ncbi:MAG: response regulator [Acidobacteriota bacterium]|nr:response regulator [Acidobacteriota bacterium]